MTSRSRGRSRRRTTTGAGRRSRLSRAGSGRVALTFPAVLSSVRDLSLRLAGLTRSPRLRSTNAGRSRRSRSPSQSLKRYGTRSHISVVRSNAYSSGLESLLPPGFRKFYFLADMPTRSMTSASSYSVTSFGSLTSQGDVSMPTWTPPPTDFSTGPRIPSTPSRATSV
jgi:hypothetical protein